MTSSAAMKAVVYKGPNDKAWEPVDRPVVSKPTDAIVNVLKTTIGGTDLYILKGDVPAFTSGRILGQKA